MQRDALVAELANLYELTGRLRKECPWDCKQTQESIVAYTVEEVYELVDAIARRHEQGDAAVCGELGDLLYQVFFLACVAEEQELYDLGDVAAGISAKLVRRHPHIFGEAKAETPDEVHETWEAIKRDTEGRTGYLSRHPGELPVHASCPEAPAEGGRYRLRLAEAGRGHGQDQGRNGRSRRRARSRRGRRGYARARWVICSSPLSILGES